MSEKTLPSSSTRVMFSPAGVDDRPQVRPRGPHQVGHVPGRGPGVAGHDRGGGGVGVHHQDLGPQLGEHVGHDEARGPEGVVEHHLEPGPGDGVDVDGVAQRGGVELEGARRVADVADLRRQGPPELLSVVEPLDLALPGLGDVDAVLVEEADHHRLGVLLEEADRDAARGSAPSAPGSASPGTVATSRSSTFTPAALQPTIMARLSTRAARDVSREAVMVLPFSSVLAHAIDSRMTSSGLMSTLARPVMPEPPEQRARAPVTPTRSRC